jgi:NADH:ubiquinone oxidoreductase subunit 5 (subunit L)/multisubunit Na+/H+ antiporter MnhA subunit
MTGVLVVLGVASLVVGWFNIPKGLINLGELNGLFHHFLAPVTDRGSLVVANAIGAGMPHDTAALGPVIVGDVQHEGVLDVAYHGPEILLAIVSVLIAAGGLGLAWVLYGSGDLSKGRKLAKNPLLKPFWNISWSGWRWDDAYDALFVRGAMALYAGVLWIDRNIVDGIVNGAGRLSRGLGNEFRRLQNGQVQVYGLVMFLGVCLFLLYFALGLTRFLTNDPVMEIQNNRRDVPALSDVAPQGEQVSAVIESDHSRTEQ